MDQGIYSTLTSFVEENTNKYDGYFINQDKYDKIVDMCEELDDLIEQLASEDVYLDSNDETKRFSIEIECDEVVFQNGRHNVFFKIIQSADLFSFQKRGEGMVITLFFDDLWVVA